MGAVGFSAVEGGAASVFFMKALREVKGVAKADHFGDFLDRQGGADEQVFGLGEPDRFEVGGGSDPGAFFEEVGVSGGGETGQGGEVVHGDGIGKIFLDVADGFFDPVVRSRMGRFRVGSAAQQEHAFDEVIEPAFFIGGHSAVDIEDEGDTFHDFLFLGGSLVLGPGEAGVLGKGFEQGGPCFFGGEEGPEFALVGIAAVGIGGVGGDEDKASRGHEVFGWAAVVEQTVALDYGAHGPVFEAGFPGKAEG